MTTLHLAATLPPAEEGDRRAIRVYLIAAHWRPYETSILNLLARELGYPDASSVPWSALDYEHILALMTHLEMGPPPRQPETVNRYLGMLKGVAHKARKDRRGPWAGDWRGILDAEYLDCAALAPAQRDTLTLSEYRALLADCDADASREAGIRDKALLSHLARPSSPSALERRRHQDAWRLEDDCPPLPGGGHRP